MPAPKWGSYKKKTESETMQWLEFHPAFLGLAKQLLSHFSYWTKGRDQDEDQTHKMLVSQSSLFPVETSNRIRQT